MSERSLFVCLVLAIATSGCASTDRYKAMLRTWVGHDQSQIEQAWGTPDADEKMSSGTSMLVYSRLKHYPVAFGTAAPAGAGASFVSNGSLYIKCATYFEIDQTQKIVSTSFEGDDCPKIR